MYTPTISADYDEIQIVEPYVMNHFDEKIKLFFTSNPATQESKRLEAAAEFFLGQPYLFEPLGEGKEGKYGQEPLYRTDRFDCVTYVDTVLALIKSTDLNQFTKNLMQIRYADEDIHYTKRTDWFTDLEWLPNAQKNLCLLDVTEQVFNAQGKSITEIATTIIDKPNWYQARPMKTLRLLKALSPTESKKLLAELHGEGKAYRPEQSTLTYLPLTEIFTANGEPNDFFFAQLPSESVVVIVRPNWQIRDHFEGFPHGYGTNLNVSHMGIALRTEKDLMFYHASSLEKKVVCLPLTDYLKQYLHSDTIKGIHVEKII